MLTDGELIAATHIVLIAGLRKDMDQKETLRELNALFAENGHEFISLNGCPANDDDEDLRA